MPQIMEPEVLRKLEFLFDFLPVDPAPASRGEGVSLFSLEYPFRGPALEPPLLQHCDEAVPYWNNAPASLRLYRKEFVVAVLTPQVDCAFFKINVLPAEAEDLAPAERGKACKGNYTFVHAFQLLNKVKELFKGQDRMFGVRRGGYPALQWVIRDKLPFNRFVEDLAQYTHCVVSHSLRPRFHDRALELDQVKGLEILELFGSD